jgi:hypothetical protein
MTTGPSGPNVIPFPTVDRLAIPDRIERRSQVLEQRNRSNLHFAERSQPLFTEEELLGIARRAINEAYRHRADGLAYPHSEKITLAFGYLRCLLSMIPDGPREEEAPP